MVGPSGFEPLTPALSARCSNHLSYRPKFPLNNQIYPEELEPVLITDTLYTINAGPKLVNNYKR